MTPSCGFLIHKFNLFLKFRSVFIFHVFILFIYFFSRFYFSFPVFMLYVISASPFYCDILHLCNIVIAT